MTVPQVDHALRRASSDSRLMLADSPRPMASSDDEGLLSVSRSGDEDALTMLAE